jgi:hypothetical protein
MLLPKPVLLPALQAIVTAEIARGNIVQEVSEWPSWPPKCELLVSLTHKFGRRYNVPAGIEFLLLDDYHYWYAEYSSNHGQQLLICGFAN